MAAQSKPTLEERVKQSIKTAPAPSLVPDQLLPAPPPAKEEEVIPRVQDLVKDRKDLLLIRRLMTQHIELGNTERQAKKAKEKITAQLKVLAGRYSLGKADYDGDRLNYFAGTRSSIDSTKLLSAGVQPSVIQACTNVSTTFTLKVTQGDEEE